MNYQQCLKRLIDLDPAPKFGMQRMERLISLLNHPERSYTVLHVAGTNGKGSTCAFLDSILQEAGISRGRYTSPHLQCARERILINGALISEEDFCEAECKVSEACAQMEEEPTFFERMTAMALLSFKKAGVKVAIIEVGLGGRLDATNVIQPTVCAITNIDIDHAHILGNTIAQIAAEKAGVIKHAIPTLSAQQKPETTKVVEMRARQMNAPLWQVGIDIKIDETQMGISVYYQDKLILPTCKPGLLGNHQYQNAAVATAVIEKSGLVPDLNVRKQGIEKATWPGRYETVKTDPIVILDGAHNPAGMHALLETLSNDKRLESKALVLVVGMTDGHDCTEMADVWRDFPRLNDIIATKAKVPRALPITVVEEAFRRAGIKKVKKYSDSNLALEQAMKVAQKKKGIVVVTGSLYLVGEIRGILCDMPRDNLSPYY